MAGDLLARGREFAEELFVDSGELRGPDVDGPLDEATGQYTKVPGTLKYAGPAKAQTTETIGRATDSGERTKMVTRFELHLPMSAPAAAVDDIWRWTTVLYDPELLGRKFRVASLMHKSFLTARRMTVEEVQS